jgi:hypothetical protein
MLSQVLNPSIYKSKKLSNNIFLDSTECQAQV